MLIIALMGAVVLYLVIYVTWMLAQPQIQSATSTAHTLMTVLAEALLWPQNTTFIIFRGLILVTLLYVISDFLLSLVKRILVRARRKREDRKPRKGRNPRTGHIPSLRPQRLRDKREWQSRIDTSLNTRS